MFGKIDLAGQADAIECEPKLESEKRHAFKFYVTKDLRDLQAMYNRSLDAGVEMILNVHHAPHIGMTCEEYERMLVETHAEAAS